MYHMSVYSDVYLGIESIIALITMICYPDWMVYSEQLKVLDTIPWNKSSDATPDLLEWI